MVVDLYHVKPGKGSAFVRVKLKDLKNGSIIDVTFRGDEKIQEAFVEQRKLQFLYRSADIFHFLDQETFDEAVIDKHRLKDVVGFLKDNLDVLATFFQQELLNISLPTFIKLTVTHTEMGLKGDSARAGTKPAGLETGITIQVPLFINQGDTIRVDTRTGKYVERL